jgi:hypothetical protein
MNEAHSDRVNWKEFFADSIVGDSFIADAPAKASAVASAKRYGIKLRCRKRTQGNFLCQIVDAIDERQKILSTFASLPLHRLQAIYKAANQAKIIT